MHGQKSVLGMIWRYFQNEKEVETRLKEEMSSFFLAVAELAENYEQWLKDMDAFLSGNSDRIQIQFQSGTVMEQKIGNE